MKVGWEIEPDNVQLLALLADRFEARQQEPRGKEKNQGNMRARKFLKVKTFFQGGFAPYFLKRILIKRQPNLSRPKCDSTYWDAVNQGCALSGGAGQSKIFNSWKVDKVNQSFSNATRPPLIVYPFKFILHPIIYFILCNIFNTYNNLLTIIKT